MVNKDIQILKEALNKQKAKVTTSPKAARALLKELGLLTKSGKLKQSFSSPAIGHVPR